MHTLIILLIMCQRFFILIISNYCSIVVNDDLQRTTKKLISYITVESWHYFDQCNTLEPNKMLPTYEIKKCISLITVCVTKVDISSQWFAIYIPLLWQGSKSTSLSPGFCVRRPRQYDMIRWELDPISRFFAFSWLIVCADGINKCGWCLAGGWGC